MGRVLRQRLKQARFESPLQEAIFNVLVASGHLRERFDRVLREHDLTIGQYNVLRILLGAQPHGLPRCQISPRMLERAPDVTRIVDRLVDAGLAERARSREDGRLSITRLTRKGQALLERIQPEVAAGYREISSRLTDREAESLSALCEKLYEADL